MQRPSEAGVPFEIWALIVVVASCVGAIVARVIRWGV